MPARADSVFNCSDIGIALVRSGKKVKNRAVVPDVECLAQQVYLENVAFKPRNLVRQDVSQSGACTIHCCSRQIQNRNVSVTFAKKVIDQGGVTTAYVYNACVFGQSCAVNEV
jgi:hypothetical protein